MSIISTLNLVAFTPIKVGSVSTQPQPRTLQQPQVTRSIVETQTTFRASSTQTQRIEPPRAVNTFNRINQSYHYPLSVINRQISSNDAALTSRSFEPYERLTGISQERPELVSSIPFLSLYTKSPGNRNDESSLSNVGLYVDTQVQARNLNVLTALRNLNIVRERDETLNELLVARRRAVNSSLSTLNMTLQYMLDLIKRADHVSDQLNLKNQLHVVEPQRVAKKLVSGFNPSIVDQQNFLQVIAQNNLPLSYDLVDNLVSLGYPKTEVKQTYSSTKIWLQLLIEYKNILLFHSNELLDIDQSLQKKDRSSTTLTKSKNTPYLRLSQNDPAGLPSVAILGLTSPTDLTRMTDVITRSFREIYSAGVTYKSDEAKISGLINLLSKEIRFSTNLGTQDVSRALLKYGYTINSTGGGNSTLFDSVIGQFGSNVSDIPETTSASLASVSQQQPSNNVAILTFESKYVDGANGTVTPGSAWYIDSIFELLNGEFNTTRLDELSVLLNTTQQNFTNIALGLNFFGIPALSQQDQNSTSSLVSNAVGFAKFIFEKIIINGSTSSTIRSDRLCAIFSHGVRNPKVHSLLFLYIMNRISIEFSQRSQIDYSTIGDAIIDKLVATINDTVNEGRTSQTPQNGFELSSDAVKNALKSGTPLTRVVGLVMNQVYLSLVNSSVDSRLRYSGHYDTTAMMIAFDIVMTIIGKYGQQNIVSKRFDNVRKKMMFSIAIESSTSHQTSIDDILSRLNREMSLTHGLTYCFVNTLSKLGGSLNSFSNHLKSIQTTSKLSFVSSVVNEPSLLRMLMNEQQIMLMGSIVSDILSRFKRSSNDVVPLDDSMISPKLHNALNSTFSDPEYIGSRSHNKKVLTVGIPLGFVRRLKQRVNSTHDSFSNKQSDVINLSIYKMDVINQDIIYRPKKLLFEMSRFPVRDETLFLDMQSNSTFKEVTESIPTRDFKESFEEGTSQVGYWNSTQRSNNTNSALDSQSYSFLTASQKEELIRNHVLSHMLEIYIKLLTNLNVSEETFNLVDASNFLEPEFVDIIVNSSVRQISRNLVDVRTSSQNTTGLLFASTTKSITTASNQDLRNQFQTLFSSPSISSNTLAAATTAQTLDVLKTSSTIARTVSSVSSDSLLVKKLLAPRQFDRVFNVVVDPDEFEIDVVKTMSTPEGKIALEQLMSSGDIILSAGSRASQHIINTLNSNRISARTFDAFKFRERDKNEGDVIFERYFVSVETFGEETI